MYVYICILDRSPWQSSSSTDLRVLSLYYLCLFIFLYIDNVFGTPKFGHGEGGGVPCGWHQLSLFNSTYILFLYSNDI